VRSGGHCTVNVCVRVWVHLFVHFCVGGWVSVDGWIGPYWGKP